jgi:hypothetical protein
MATANSLVHFENILGVDLMDGTTYVDRTVSNQHNATQHNATQHNATQHNATRHNTTHHN